MPPHENRLAQVPAVAIRRETDAIASRVRGGFGRCGHSSLQTCEQRHQSAPQSPNRGQSLVGARESRSSQAAKSTRIVASSAGVACRDSPKSSVDRRWLAPQSESADITRNPNRRCAAQDMTSLLLLRIRSAYGTEPGTRRIAPVPWDELIETRLSRTRCENRTNACARASSIRSWRTAAGECRKAKRSCFWIPGIMATNRIQSSRVPASRAEKKIGSGSWKRLFQNVETVPIRGDGLCQRNTNRPRVHARARY